MKYLMIILMVVFPTVTNAQLAMTKDNHSLSPSTPNGTTNITNIFLAAKQ
jgi:hypothetical protein